MTVPVATAPMPGRVRALPRDRYGRPIPWFVDDQAGARSYRGGSADKRIVALRDGMCWVCGQKLPSGVRTRRQNRPVPFTFLVAPMVVVNRIAADPPAHEACAAYTVTACPFLSRPDIGGMVAWSTTGFTIERPRFGVGGGVLLRMGEPTSVSWWTGGRLASRGEATKLLGDAYARLVAECEYDPDPRGAADVLDRQLHEAVRWLPDIDLF